MPKKASKKASNVLSAETSTRRWLDEFVQIAAGRYRFFVCGFITAKGIVFSASSVQEHCHFFNKALTRVIAGEVAPHIESFISDLQDSVHSTRNEEQAADEIERAAKKFTLYFAAVFKPLFLRCAAKCFTDTDGLVFSLRELETLTSEFHTDISTRLKRHKQSLLEILKLQNRVSSRALSASTEAIREAAGPQLAGRKSADLKSVGRNSADKTSQNAAPKKKKADTPVTPDGISLPDFTLVDAFGRGLLAPLEDYYTIADIPIRGKQDPEIFPRAFCGPTLKILKDYLIGRDKYNSANSALLKGIAGLCSSCSTPDRKTLRTFFSEGKLKPYFISYFLHILNVLLNEDKKNNFMRRINADPTIDDGSRDELFQKRHLSMLTNSWARFTKENMDSVSALKAASAILIEYIPAMYSAQELAAAAAAKKAAEPRRKLKRKVRLGGRV